MASGSGNALQLVQLAAENIPEDAFTRCPKFPKWDYVQVRTECIACEHCAGFTQDPSVPRGQPPLYGSVCAFPIARWWKPIPIHHSVSSPRPLPGEDNISPSPIAGEGRGEE
jgi:hypothetical protein